MRTRVLLLIVFAISSATWAWSTCGLSTVANNSGLTVYKCPDDGSGGCLIKLSTLKCLETGGDKGAILVNPGQKVTWRGDVSKEFKMTRLLESDCSDGTLDDGNDPYPLDSDFSQDSYGLGDKSASVLPKDQIKAETCFKHVILLKRGKVIDPHIIIGTLDQFIDYKIMKKNLMQQKK